jgi:maleylacetate reductase
MRAFRYDQQASTVLFGAGRVGDVGQATVAIGAARTMLIHDANASGLADGIAIQLGSVIACRWNEVVQHVPGELAERARAMASKVAIDSIVCVGGGSSIGLAKAIALTHAVPIVAVPTTYAGSEQTTIYGLSGDRHKRTGKDPKVLPRVVVYDPETTVGLPPEVTGPSAFNALAHSVEALYAPGCNPVTSVLALEGVRAITVSLPVVMAAPHDVEARSELLFGAYLSGMALGATSAALHHKICHVLGGLFNLVHADAHSVVLPHAVAFNAPALPEEMSRLAIALGQPGGDPAGALWDLAVASNVPTSLAELQTSSGVLRREQLGEAAERAVTELASMPAPGNPRPVAAADILRILHGAFIGQRPNAGAAIGTKEGES